MQNKRWGRPQPTVSAYGGRWQSSTAASLPSQSSAVSHGGEIGNAGGMSSRLCHTPASYPSCLQATSAAPCTYACVHVDAPDAGSTTTMATAADPAVCWRGAAPKQDSTTNRSGSGASHSSPAYDRGV